ncbi:ABC transporter ATP-binding protein [Pseudonocardia ailaonensis]|uniref:ABC transporter ATP-binding protein n=1 Tax=Pseudonocardia ailaonensis TaxID=367279 RepID=A0ABN2N5B3_9PSEU
MLDISSLACSYGRVEAVRDISLRARPGEITLVLGANGAGKTTMMNAVAGLLKPAAGTVRLGEEDLTGLPPHVVVRHGLALVPEGRRIFGPMTVAENLRLGGYLRQGARLREVLARVHEMFPVLHDRRDVAAGLLSGGEQQMLAFGRALMSEPTVLLLDEPSMGLAPVMTDVVLGKVAELAATGLGVLMVEQNADAGLDIADQVVAVARGSVVYSGDAADARNHASVLRAFLGEAALAPAAESGARDQGGEA